MSLAEGPRFNQTGPGATSRAASWTKPSRRGGGQRFPYVFCSKVGGGNISHGSRPQTRGGGWRQVQTRRKGGGGQRLGRGQRKRGGASRGGGKLCESHNVAYYRMLFASFSISPDRTISPLLGVVGSSGMGTVHKATPKGLYYCKLRSIRGACGRTLAPSGTSNGFALTGHLYLFYIIYLNMHNIYYITYIHMYNI